MTRVPAFVPAIATVVALTILAGAAAGMNRVKTYIYVGSRPVASRPVGYVLFLPDTGREWQLGVDGCDLNIAYAEHGGPKELEEKEGIGSVFAVLTRASATSWNYRRVAEDGQRVERIIGRAVRVSSNTWEVYGPRRRIGFVRGRDGPAAALALLTTWPRLLRCLR
jgi:hypothetical protein